MPPSAPVLPAGVDRDPYKRGIKELAVYTPIAEELKEMALASVKEEERPELACMLLEIEAFEKHVCQYCKAAGHKR